MFFSRAKKSTRLILKSNSIVDVFTKTKDDLEQANREIALERDAIRAQMESLQDEANSLKATSDRNSKVITNIDKILE
jgi:cell division protein FtsB